MKVLAEVRVSGQGSISAIRLELHGEESSTSLKATMRL